MFLMTRWGGYVWQDKFRVEKVELERQLRESRAKLEEAEAQGRSLSREKDEALSEVSHLKEECQWVETKLAKVQAMANAAPVSNSGGNAALEEVREVGKGNNKRFGGWGQRQESRCTKSSTIGLTTSAIVSEPPYFSPGVLSFTVCEG